MPSGYERTITALGKTQTIGEWARETGLRTHTLYHRIFTHGWEPERAVTIKNGHAAHNRSRRMKRLHRRRKVRILAEQGLSADEIAERLGCTANTVRRDMAATNIGRMAQIRERRRKVWTMIGTMNQADMARALRCSSATIHNDIKALMRNPPRSQVESNDMCDCGQPATHVEEVRLRERTFAEMPLCESCYELFLEVENRS